MTREQLATLLYRFYGSPAISGTLRFADAGAVSAYAQDALLWATQNGIMNGVGNNCVAPSADAQRAQVAAMMARYLKNADSSRIRHSKAGRADGPPLSKRKT